MSSAMSRVRSANRRAGDARRSTTRRSDSTSAPRAPNRCGAALESENVRGCDLVLAAEKRAPPAYALSAAAGAGRRRGRDSTTTSPTGALPLDRER
jgi:hypothetical protein